MAINPGAAKPIIFDLHILRQEMHWTDRNGIRNALDEMNETYLRCLLGAICAQRGPIHRTEERSDFASMFYSLFEGDYPDPRPAGSDPGNSAGERLRNLSLRVPGHDGLHRRNLSVDHGLQTLMKPS
jgi:hypothetical protein